MINPEILRYVRYLSFKQDCMREQEENPLKIDRPKAQKYFEKLSSIVETKRTELQAAMPKTVVEHNRPKRYKKANGELTKWGIAWDEKCKDFGQAVGTHKFLEYIDGNPNSDPQIKEWLFSLGWEPCTHKFTRNKLTGDEKQIPQVRYFSPNDPRKGELTESIRSLISKEPALEALDGLTVAKHRMNIFKALLTNSDEEGYCSASAGGFTNTLRFQHRNPFVNLPKADGDVPWGVEIRGCIIAPDGYEMCGSDVVSLEDTTKRHYMYPHDPDYVDEMSKDGFDPHLDLAKYAGAVTEQEIEDNGVSDPQIKQIRKQYKATNYCLPMNTKVLTKGGWKYYKDIEVGEVLPSYNKFSGEVEDSVVEQKHFYPQSELVRVSNKNTSFTCTPNHRWFSQRRVNSKAGLYYKMDFVETKDIKQDDNLILTGRYKGSDGCVTPNEAFFMGLLLSDGYYKWAKESQGPSTSKGTRRGIVCMVAQSKNKFWKELEASLENLGLGYRKDIKEEANGNDVYKYYLICSEAREFLTRVMGTRENKYDYNWTKWVMALSRQSLESFYYGFYLGDGGTSSERVVISQNTGNVFDALVAASQLLGYGRVTLSGNSKCRDITIMTTERLTGQKLVQEPVENQDVFCLTTSTGTFILWQDDFVGITGNSAIYGIGSPKLARELFITQGKAQSLLDAYWDRNKAVKKVSEEQYVKTLKDGSMWLKNKVSGFYYSLRYDKDRWSTTNQGTGVFIFDSWVMRLREKGVVVQGQMHDEVFFKCLPCERDSVRIKLDTAMEEVNTSLNLNVDISVDIQFGDSYGAVH